MPSSRKNKIWYLLVSKPQQERYAKENLDRQGYDVYLPIIEVNRRRRGRYQKMQEPMFPRYLFIRLDQDTDNWAPIRSTYGVSGIVYFGGIPASVGNELIESLKCNDNEQGIHEIPEPELKPGDNVRIIDGVMAGYEGIYHVKSGKERVSILLEYTGKHMKIDVSQHHIERAS
jgi:transcriptional antiterminator RfaH